MRPVVRFPFVNLSTELVLLILAFAARPDFAQTDEEKNPYSSALALCRLSRITRRAVLPQLLRTVLLSDEDNVISFVHALRMQKIYRQQGNHLYFPYTAHVHRIWIGKISAPPPAAPLHGSFPSNTHDTSEPDIDFSVLAPVILGAQSLAVDFASLFLLCGCLERAWSTHIAINVDTDCSPPPWNTKTLALSGECTRWLPLTSTAEGSAFIASISHLIFLSPSRFRPWTVCRFDPCFFDDEQFREYSLPEWLTSVPWVAFKNIQAVSLSLPHIVTQFEPDEPLDLHVELLTLSAPPGHRGWVPKNISNSFKNGEGRVSLVDVRPSYFRVSCISLFDVLFAWEEAWACGLSPVSMHKLPTYPLEDLFKGPSDN